MSDHYVKGLNLFREYRTTLGIDLTDERIAASLGIPIIHLKQNATSYGKRVAEPQSEAVADLLGQSVADTRTNTGMVVAP